MERVQKTALAIIIGRDYSGYKDALKSLNVETLEERRIKLCLNFAKKAAKSDKWKHWFVKSPQQVLPPVNTRSKKAVQTEYKEVPAITDRYRQ